MKIQCIFKKFSGGQAPQTPLFFTSFYTEIVSAFYHVITPHFFLICCTCYLENNLKFFDSPLLKILATPLSKGVTRILSSIFFHLLLCYSFFKDDLELM